MVKISGLIVNSCVFIPSYQHYYQPLSEKKQSIRFLL